MYLNQALVEYESYISLELKAITARGYVSDLKSFCVYMRNAEVSGISDRDVVSYLNFLKDVGYMHNGVAKKSQALRNFWKWVNKKKLGTFSYELIPCIDFEYTHKRIADETNYRKLLSVIPDKGYCHVRDRAMVMLFWDTGARRGEILSLDMKDIDLGKMKALVRTEKSRGKRPFREIYWTTETNNALKQWVSLKRELEKDRYIHEPHVLFWGSTNNYQGKRLTGNAVGTALRKYSRLANIPSFNPHSMRHHMGHDLSQKGANNSTISSILGHSDLRSSYVYTEMSNNEREMAYEKYKRRHVSPESKKLPTGY